ncbi:MAG: WYL domain-containing protein, partial [Deltaproteobacteria bacterium]
MSLTAERRIRNALFVIPFVERNREVDVEDLARRLDMPVEQLLQELDELCMVGTYPFSPDNYVEIYEEGGKVKVALHQNFNRMPRLSLPEALALAVAAGPFSDEGVSGSLATATRVTLDKIRKALPEGLHGVIDQLSARVAVEFESGIESQLEGIQKAIDERLELELEYYAANRDSVTRRVVRPYALLQRKGHWYMVGWCSMRKEPRVFRLSRIYSLEVSDRIFDPPPADFDPVSFLDNRLSVPREGERKFRLRF